MMRIVLSALCAMLFPLEVSAQTTLGTITASVAGTERTWYITEEDGETQSLLMSPMSGLFQVTLWGNPSAEINAQIEGAMILGFMVLNRGGAQVMEPTLQWLEQGYGGGWLALDESAVSITMTSAEETETGLTLAGTFKATAAFSDQVMAQIVDPNRSVEIEGSFEANLPLR